MREVVVTQSVSPQWKEIVVNTGASASTLQDIKVPDSCGGYTYKDSGQPGSPVRNRYIYWRTCVDVLEVEESSLDLVLTGGRVRYRLQDTPIVGGVSVSETQGQVIILVATVASVHRLAFPHPCRRAQPEAFSLSEHIANSIFYDASLSTATDARNLHMLNPGGSMAAHLMSAASCVNGEGEAVFALGTNTGTVLLLKMPPIKVSGVVIQHELSQSSVMQKLWTGLIPGAIRGHQQASDTAISLELQPLQGECFIFALCRDLRLRVWTTKTRECVLTVNLLDMLTDQSHEAPSSSGHVIKQVQSSTMAALTFCVYLSFRDRSQFLLLEPVLKNDRLSVIQHATLTQPAEDLIDFSVTGDQLITLWADSNGESIARSALLTEGSPTGEWRELLLEPMDTSEPLIPANQDPRDFFLDLIFKPSEFFHQDIMRALNVYRRSHDSSQNPDALLMSINLREEVVNAVSLEIRNCASEYEMNENDYYQLQLDQWGRFYSCCCQYREVGAKLQGMFTDSVTGLVCLIRKATVTYMRPCDLLEKLYHCPEERLTPRDLEEVDFTAEGVSGLGLCEDVHKVCEVARLVQGEVTEEMWAAFLLGLHSGQSPKLLAEDMVNAFYMDNEVPSEVGALVDLRLQHVRELVPCLDLLARLLDVQEMMDLQHGANNDSVADATQQLSASHLFTSAEATSVVAKTFQQVCLSRLCFLRDLLLIQVLTLRCGIKWRHGSSICHNIEQELLPTYSNLIRSYVLLYWASQALTATSPTSSLDSNMRRLASLEINESSGFPSSRPVSSPVTVLESFIHGVGGTQARQLVALTLENDVQATWPHDLMAFVHSLAGLIWPLNDETIFPEFLAGACQYGALQEYVRLLRSCNTWNKSAAMFFLGLSYLYFDEPHKAHHCFVGASEGIATETFLSQKLLQGSEGSHRQLTVQYYLKVISQFEEHALPDMVIALADQAMRLADPDDPTMVTLHSKVFKHQLALGHNEEAFTSMMSNPEPARRKDCLRQLLVVLSDRGQLDALVHFKYKDLEEEVVSILESRARSVDLATHNYYNLLYSFHVYRNNLRKAASVMFEHGLRLGRELSGVRALQRQAQCYLVAMNALRLVNQDYAWIIKPHIHTIMAGGLSPLKHTVDGEEKPTSHRKKVQIVELKHLEKDYLLLDARLRLIRKNPDPSLSSGPTAGADEMVGLLVNAGLYDMAVVVSQAFSLQLHTVFSSLALRCVSLARSSSYLMLGDNQDTAEAWDWLRENDVQASHQSKDGSATDYAWKLLQRYLDSLEETDARYHRCVSEKLLSQAFPLPTWLVNSYKVWSAPQLLRVYLDYDLLQPAAHLLMEYLDSLLTVLHGAHAPVFNLKAVLNPGPMSVWAPYTCADQLLGALHRHHEVRFHRQLHAELAEKLEQYQRKVSELSGHS